MSELTFKIDYLNMNNKELEEYILALNGVVETKTNPDKDEVYIKYNSKLIGIERLVLEVKLFLSLAKTPAIVSFDKHLKENIIDTTIIIDDACCEYCVKGMIEELLLLDGIIMASSDFDYMSFFNVPIEIKYDKNLFDEKKINDLKIKLSDL